MKQKLFTIIKYLNVYGHLPPIKTESYKKMPGFLSLMIKYMATKLFKNRALLKFYPLAAKGTFFEKPLYLKDNGFGYYLQYYKHTSPTTAFLSTPEMAYFKGEQLLAKKNNKAIESKYKFKQDVVLPISIVNSDVYKVPSINTVSGSKYSLKIKLNNKKMELKNLAQNRYHYLPFKKGDKVEIKSNQTLIMGKPLNIQQTKKTDKKLVLMLFADSFASKLFKKKSFEKVMPHTFEFFSKGCLFNNHFINGHWTLDSVPTFITGKYPVNHGLFNPFHPEDVSKKNKVLSEYYHENGYMTFHVGSNQRVAPNFGYSKGFDRVVYARHQPCEDIIMETLEQLKSFPERSQFGFLTLMDLHLVKPIPDISSQIGLPLSSHDYSRRQKGLGKTKLYQYDQSYDDRYMEEAKRLDFYLKILFDYILKNYAHEDMLVSLVSDHGYLSAEETDILSNGRISVPFMIRGGGVKQGELDDLTENVDIFPTMLHFSKIKKNSFCDGTLPVSLGGTKNKEYTFIEKRYPKQPYQAVINNNKYSFNIKSSGLVDMDGMIDLGSYESQLYDKELNEYITDNESLRNKYTKIVFEHTKKIQKS